MDKRGTGFPGYKLSSSSTASSGSTASTARTSNTGSSATGAPTLSKEAKARQEEMREVRLQQQEIANERHVEAEKQRKEKKDEERARKNKVAQAASAKNTAGDNRLGGEARGGFNPMMPSTGNTGGYRYVCTGSLCVWIELFVFFLTLYSLHCFVVPDSAQRRSTRRG
jgi:hypothetical protein